MPTFPLYEPRELISADAWHRVGSPGGYEWWHFDAQHATQDVQLVAAFFDGFALHPGYVRQYARYRRRPTRRPPPLPADYPGVCFAVYENGKALARFVTQYPPSQLRASTERCEVSIGPNAVVPANGALRLTICGPAAHCTSPSATPAGGHEVHAELSFRPLFQHPPHERVLVSSHATGAEHRWVIAAPLCSVEAAVRCGGRRITFSGRGYHDHHYGTGPLTCGIQRWTRGRVLLEDRVLAFQITRLTRGPGRCESHLIVADADGIRDLDASSLATPRHRRTATLLAYPTSVELGASLELTQPRLLDASPTRLWLDYQALRRGKPAGRALCEVTRPSRLRWPLLGRMIERTIARA